MNLATGAPVPRHQLVGLAPIAGQRNEFSTLRASADLLRVAGSLGRLARARGAEFFRSQHEFNHVLVDVLEDQPWLEGLADRAGRIEARLAPWAEQRLLIPRKPGLRGRAVRTSKWLLVSVLRSARRGLLETLRLSNRALIEAAKANDLETWRVHLRHAASILGRARDFEPWVPAQLDFVAQLERFQEAFGAPSRSFARPASPADERPAPGGRKRVSILVLPGATPPPTSDDERIDAVERATTEVLIRLPPGEHLTPGGLSALARAFEDPRVQLAYGNTDTPRGGVIRPGWSPEYLLDEVYIGGCFAIRQSRALACGLAHTDSAHRWLLGARLEEEEVVHVRRFVSSRTEPAPSEPLDENAIRAHLARSGLTGRHLAAGRRGLHIEPPAGSHVSIVVPFRDRVELLEELWHTLEHFDAGVSWDLLLASNQSTDRRTFAFLASIAGPRVRWFQWNHPFNYSAINNAAARLARGTHVLFLNNDIAIRHDGWLADLVGYSALNGVGVVGCRLSYPDGSLQHAGVVIGLKGLAGHVFTRWRPEYGVSPFGEPTKARNWSAVTGACLLMRRDLFENLGGFDERMRVSGSDIELCLKARARGARVVCVGQVELTHFESQSRGRDPVPRDDVALEVVSYERLLRSGDPYYDPALSLTTAIGGRALAPLTPTEHAIQVAYEALAGLPAHEVLDPMLHRS